jgi:hypothetical protein
MASGKLVTSLLLFACVALSAKQNVFEFHTNYVNKFRHVSSPPQDLEASPSCPKYICATTPFTDNTCLEYDAITSTYTLEGCLDTDTAYCPTALG